MTARTRVVVALDSGVWGGAEQFVRLLAAHLPAELDLVLFGAHEQVLARCAQLRPDAEVVIEPVRTRSGAFGQIRHHRRALRALRPDLVHVVHAVPTSGLYALLAAASLRRVATVAVECTLFPVGRRFVPAKAAAGRAADAYVAISDAVADHAVRQWHVPRSRIRVVPTGIDPGPPPPARPGRDGPLRVVTVARLVENKGVADLVDALGHTSDWTLTVVGDGSERASLERQADALGVRDRTRFTGHLDDPRPELDGADVFALASRSEALSLAILEAMAAGLPVVATRVGGIPEAVAEGETGILVPARDPGAFAHAFSALAADPEGRARLGAAGRRRAETRFSAEATAASFAELYRGLLTR